MTDVPRPPACALSGKKILAVSLTLFVFFLLLAGAADYAFDTAQNFAGLRNECLLSAIAAGFGITVCLAGFVYLLDMPLKRREAEGFDRSDGPRWHFRVLLALGKWLAMVLQLAAIGLALAAAGILIFGFDIPGPNASHNYPAPPIHHPHHHLGVIPRPR